ncbi:MAG: TetR/AcrR family transcriptional regulator [Armatimonadetes bacterium]|nr:TetR/AcrR family transcriptional regulator [Armatimonadota bacterium]
MTPGNIPGNLHTDRSVCREERPLPRQRADQPGVRSRILNSALREFSQRGYHRAILDEIATGAGVSKGAVYWHFENKGELFLAVIRQEISRLIEHLEGVARGGGGSMGDGYAGKGHAGEGSAVARLRAVVAAAVVYYADHPEFCNLLQLSTLPVGLELTREVESMARDMYRQGREMVGALVREGVHRGELDAGRAGVAAPLLVALLDGLMSQWIVDRRGVPLRRLAPDVAGAFLEGIVKRAG